MKEFFGMSHTGEETYLYTISCGGITAMVTDYGATLVKLLVPDADGNVADVVLGHDDPAGYRNSTCFFGATVGRSANRIGGASFEIGGKVYQLAPTENANNLHSGPDFYHDRVWKVLSHTESTITLELNSPNCDQGFPVTLSSLSPIPWTTRVVCTSSTTANVTRIPSSI